MSGYVRGCYTAFLQHFFPGQIELLILKFADQFEALAIIDGFFNNPEVLDMCRRSPIPSPDFLDIEGFISHVKVSALGFISHVSFFALLMKR
jgi:hypothetical protein